MYLVAVLFAAFVCFSCSDDDKGDDEELTGVWNYGSKGDIYFELGYSEATIELPEVILNMLPAEMKAAVTALFPDGKIPVASIKTVLAPYAKQQMQKYFRGINFLSDKELEILITKDGKDQKIKTDYDVQGSVLKISTQSEDFKTVTENAIPEDVKSIDLNYFFKDGKLTLYVNTTYAKTIIAMIPTILVAAEVIPEVAEEAVKNEIQKISSKITKLELGPVLVR